MLEELFSSPYRTFGLLYIYLFILYKFSNLTIGIFNLIGIPYDLEMSNGLQFGATLDFILGTIFFYFICVLLYNLAHAIAAIFS